MRLNRRNTLTLILFLSVLLLGGIGTFLGDNSLWSSKFTAISTIVFPLLLGLAAWRLPVSSESSNTDTNSTNLKQEAPGLIVPPTIKEQQLKVSTQKNKSRKKSRLRLILIAGSIVLFVVLGSIFAYQQSSTYTYPGPYYYAQSPQSWTTSLAWSPNGTSLAMADYNGNISLWDVTEGRRAVISPSQGSTIYSIAWSPDNKYIAFGGDTDKVEFIDITTDSLNKTSISSSDSILAVSWSPKGDYIAFGGNNKLVQIWDFINNKLIASYNEDGVVRTLAWSTDGKYLASGGDDGKIHVWDVYGGKNSFTSPGYTGETLTLKWSPHSDFLLASGGTDDEIRLWDTRKTSYMDNPTKFFQDPTGNVEALAWSPNGTFIAGGDNNGSLHIWNTDQNNIVGTYQFPVQKPFTYPSGFFEVHTIGWSSNGRYIAISESWGVDGYYYYNVQLVNFCENWCIFHR